LGFQDPTLWPFFAGERKSGSSRQGFESLLTGKKHPKLPEISQIWVTFGYIFFFTVFSAFLRVFPFGMNRNYCYRSFFVEFWDSDPKDPDRIQILFLE
jgi:ABC-type multidrug transport system permease subunit